MRAAQAPKASKGILKSLQEDGVYQKTEMLDTTEVSDFMKSRKAINKNNDIYAVSTEKCIERDIDDLRDLQTREFDAYIGQLFFDRNGSLENDHYFLTVLKTFNQHIKEKEAGGNKKLHLHFIVHDQLRKHFTRLEIIISTTQQKDKPNEITDVKIKHIDSKYQDNGQREVSGLNQKHSAMASHVKTAFNVQKDVQYDKEATTQQNDSYSCGYIVLSDILSSVSNKNFTTDDIRLEIAKTLFQQDQENNTTAAAAVASITENQIKIAKPEDVEKYKSLGIKEGDLIYTKVLDERLKAPNPSVTAMPNSAAVAATATSFDKEFDQLEDAKKIELITEAFKEVKKKIDCHAPKEKFEIAKDTDTDEAKITISSDKKTCEIYLTRTYYDSATTSNVSSEVILKRTLIPKDASKPDSVEWTCTSTALSPQKKYEIIAAQAFAMRAANQNALKTSGIKHHEIEVLPLDGKAPTNAPSTKGDINKLADPKEKMVIQAFFTAGFKKVVYCGESFENPAASVSTASLFHNHSATQTDPSSSSLTPGP